ncbi:EamA family transporter RarD [Nocardioides sp. CFH 31398]|uniref:EamA family transporter RarD n=1 Tax=Nocardioides sp. CFH 31398 TaxID=2919579 RepID=UPI001F0636D2|nr:EamA family transporter RarD [Nocardioides sp. CFH 31398]MCH1865197.1 EamA family transporter RarD [Nocardioides sp. CFH 31398]
MSDRQAPPSTQGDPTELRRGFLLGLAAYGMWGAFPLYFPLLEPAGAVELLAQRVLWSAATMVLLLVGLRKVRPLRRILRDRRRVGLLLVAACVIAVNWGVFIWGTTNGRVIEVSLGYFVNPLVTVLIGVLVLRERLRPLQWAALAFAGVAVLLLTLDYGRPPWVSLALAFSFGTYGLVRKLAGVGAIEGLTFESLALAPLAGAYVGWLAATGASTFGTEGPVHALLLASAGLVTAVPLLCFGAAATRVPLVTIGLLQYVAPTLQFLLGLFVFGEDMPAERWIGFSLVWLALVLLTAETLGHRRRTRRAAVAVPEVA